MPLHAFLANVIAVIFLLTFPIVLAFLARRMLGSPIGWPRSLIVGVGIELLGASLGNLIMREAGLEASEAEASAGEIYLVLVLALAWAFALGVAALVFLEVIAPTGSIPTPLAVMRNMRRSLRQFRRTMVIARIASRHGLAQFIRRSRGGRSTQNATPEALAAALEDGGPTFVKLGQMLSSRSDLLSDEYVAALARLQSQVRAAEWSTIRAELEEELGGSLDDHFVQVDETPLAAASIAQVHAATLLDGTPVVIKVQRPDARARVLRDAELIRRIGATIESRTEWGKSFGVTALADGFTDSLALELDYTAELRHSELIRQASLSQAITIPAMYPALSTGSMLTMERANGVPLGAAAPFLASYSRQEAAALADRIFEVILRQILIQGVFHADLHPGNILLGEEGGVILLDFGSVGILDRVSRMALTRLLTAVDSDDAVAAVDALSMVCTIPNHVDRHLLEREVGRLLTVARSSGGGGAELFPDLFSLVRRHRISVPPAIAAALRAIATLEGSLIHVDPAFNIVAAARDVAPRILRELVTVRSVVESLTATAASLAGTGARLPRRVESITADLESGAFARRFHPFAHRADRMFLQGLVEEMLRTAIAVALIIASVTLTITEVGPMLTPTMRMTNYVGLCLGVVAFVLTLRVLVRKFDRGGHPGVDSTRQ